MTNRLDSIRQLLEKLKMDAVLVTDGYNMHHISSYSGHEGVLLITGDKAYLITDSRYTEAAGKEAPDFEVLDIKGKRYPEYIDELLKKGTSGKVSGRKLKLGFEDKSISYEAYRKYASELEGTAELVELGMALTDLRKVKTESELSCLAKAESIGDDAFAHITEYLKDNIKNKITETDVALELEVYMRKHGASGLSFDTITASGVNSSMPHAVPTGKVIEKGDFLTMDFGCVYKGYCSDMTRTVFIGGESDISDEQRRVYETVYKAQTESLKLIKPGAKCSDVDRCARDIIAEAGYGDFFGHGLGHGVGLYIHEEPRFSPKCEEELVPGVVITCEPGIYLPGRFGVRIEDMVAVTENGYVNLAHSDKQLIFV